MSVFAKSHNETNAASQNERAGKLLDEISALLSEVQVNNPDAQAGGKRRHKRSAHKKSGSRKSGSKKKRSKSKRKSGSRKRKSGSKMKRGLNPFMRDLIELKRYIKAEIGTTQPLNDVGAFSIAASDLLKKHDKSFAKAKAGFNASTFIKAYIEATKRPRKPRKSKKSKSASSD